MQLCSSRGRGSRGRAINKVEDVLRRLATGDRPLDKVREIWTFGCLHGVPHCGPNRAAVSNCSVWYMAPELPALASPLLSRHLTLGCSTGYMAEHRNDWDALVDEAAAVSSMAVELSAISAPELPGLLEYLRSAPRLPFLFVSVHAPSKGVGDEEELVDTLCRIPAWVDAIVVHPDTMSDPGLYRQLGRRLVLENMDTRKRRGHTAEDLATVFAEVPDARLCLDLAHAKDVDPSLGVAAGLLERFSSRLSHVHLSSLDASQHHVPLTPDDEKLFGTVLARCRDVPWILEAPPPS